MSRARATGRLVGALAVAAGAAAAVAAVGPGASGASAPHKRGGIGKELVADNLNQPIYATAASGVSDYVYVVEREGRVQAVDVDTGAKTEFLDISSRVSTAGEGGLLSIAFDPGYASNDLLYAYYTTDSSHTIEIDEFTATSDTDGNEASRREVITIPHPNEENHQGGTIRFGPDGQLYAAVGDGGGGGDSDESAQDRSELTGKVLRINPHGASDGDYTSPPGNPFVGKPGEDEIYALGLRNPFRFNFDDATGRIAIGDVGQNAFEEVDVEGVNSLKAANFGWDHFEGTHKLHYPGDDEAPRPRKHYEPPVLDYSHHRGNVVVGGVWVYDPALTSLEGRYLYGDYSEGWLRSFKFKDGDAKGDRKEGAMIDRLTSINGGPPDDNVYVTSITTGKLFRLTP